MTFTQDWLKASMALWTLSGEMAVVMTLRGLMVAGGGAAASAEMNRMVNEKIAAGLAWQAMAMRGGLGTTLPTAVARSAQHYRKRVSANRRRLTKI